MPKRGAFLFSCALHLAVAALFFVHLPFFERRLPEETPIVVDIVNLAPETHATEKTVTPPVPEKPKKIALNEPAPEPPKPPPPKPEPPKPAPPPTPPPSTPAPPPPPPPPEPKPPAPKPPQPKPAPPKPPAPRPDEKPQPPKPQAKKPDVDFDALLKNLAKRSLSDLKPDKPAKTTPETASAASSQPIAPLAARLSTSEIDLVTQQIERCWNVPAGARDAQDLRPEFRIEMNSDGTVRGAQLLNTDRLSDPFFQAAADAAKRAILNANCHGPLKFPPDKYDQWQTFTITFDPKDIT